MLLYTVPLCIECPSAESPRCNLADDRRMSRAAGQAEVQAESICTPQNYGQHTLAEQLQAVQEVNTHSFWIMAG